MDEKTNNKLSNVLFIPHGGGPLPLLGDNSHQEMVAFLKKITTTLGKPSAILIISAHWEEDKATITSGKAPSLIYDYSGFPDESYHIQYPALGSPALAEKIYNLLRDSGIEARLDDKRGFDHGVFVPLTIMFPEANIPCVQLSLLSNLEPKAHIQMGKALAGLRNDNVLVIGSGLSFHNMREFFQASGYPDEKNEAFERWLIDTCTDEQMTAHDREQQLETWTAAPFARYCHPREEHLLPLHVCYGFSNSAAELVFDGNVIGKKASAFLW